jgi:phosphatidylglycerophosphate synthase
MPDLEARRPLKSRNVVLFQKLAATLSRAGVSPNAISAASILFGGVAGVAFAATAHAEGWMLRALWIAAALGIQFRLLANMLDGMVAVEGGKGGPTGDLWNEAPDRISDAATLIGAGYAAGSHPILGLIAALMAVFVAYVRALGASVGAGQIFLGPQAKPHRMAVLTVASLITAAAPTYPAVTGTPSSPLIAIALWIVIVGGAITAWRRLARIAAYLRGKARP